MKIYGDLETFLLDEEDRMFQLLVYKRIFTPYEQENKFVDESEYEDWGSVKVVELINLQNDYLLGVQSCDEDTGELFNKIEYYKLSEIRLCYFGDEKNIELRKENDYENYE